jgi:hypothetical protein
VCNWSHSPSLVSHTAPTNVFINHDWVRYVNRRETSYVLIIGYDMNWRRIYPVSFRITKMGHSRADELLGQSSHVSAGRHACWKDMSCKTGRWESKVKLLI